jgi:integrase
MSVRKRKWTTRAGVEKEAWIVDYADQQGIRRLKTFKRKKDADAFSASTHVEVREGTHVADRATVTVKEAAENWIKSGEAAGLEKATLAQYRQHVELHILPFIGRTKLSQISVPAVRHFQDRLRSGDESLPDDDPRKEPRSVAMVKRVTGSLGSILADAQDRGLVARNAVREMARRQPRGKQRQGERRRKARLQVGVDIPTPAEITAIIHAVKGRWRPFLITAVFTGLRASELRGLRWSDVDLKEGKVHVRQRADRYHAIGMPKSDAGQRTIPIGPNVVNTLKEWKLACPKGDLDLVFPTGAGAVEGHPNIIRRGLIPPQIAAGITAPVLDDEGKPIVQAKYTGLHALRHFFASWCINRRQDGGRELPPKTVQHLMGHSSITMTMDTYGHLFPASDDGMALAEAETALLRAV